MVEYPFTTRVTECRGEQSERPRWAEPGQAGPSAQTVDGHRVAARRGRARAAGPHRRKPRLFRREGRSIRLSAEGHILLTYTDRLLRLADETVSEMRTGKPKGVFRLGALESTAGSRLAPILSRYHSAYPDVVVELATGTTAALVTRVSNFELEAAFVSEPFTAPGLEARPVFDERLG